MDLKESYIYTFISSQIPEHIKNDYEMYELFLKAYYEWMCSEGNPIYAVDNLSSFLDIDKAPEFFYKYLKDEILSEFPDNVLADKRLLLRYAKDFYERKGTEASYDFLFKVLYNDNINITYPSDNILKASDGKWVVEYTLYVKSIQGDPFDLVSTYLYTEDEKTVLETDDVKLVREGKYEIYQITLSPNNIEFNAGDRLYNKDKSVIVETYGIIKDIEVINGGNGYAVGDLIPITDESGNGINAIATISKVNADNKITGFNIISGGHNYRVGDQLVFNVVNGGSGASAYVDEIVEEELSKQCLTTLETEQNVFLDDVKQIKIEDYVKFESFSIGSIKSIKLVSGGIGYKTLPIITISQQKLYDLPDGYGAVIGAKSNSLGQVKEISLINRGIGFVNEDDIKIDLSQLGNGKAVAKAHIYGGIVESDGFWKNNDGKLNSTPHLQDNKYYQNFSYVINSAESVNEYKNIVTNMIHPAGTQLYGEINVFNEVDAGIDFDKACDKEMIVHIQKEIISTVENLIKEMVVHIEKGMSSADIYGYEYFINDFKDDVISSYRNMVLHDFVAIYQDLLIYDLQYMTMEQLNDSPINTLYGCSRPSVDSAQISVISH